MSINLDDIFRAVHETQEKCWGELRYGQALFTEVARRHPELADKLRGGLCDPFYDDTKVGAFIEQLLILED